MVILLPGHSVKGDDTFSPVCSEQGNLAEGNDSRNGGVCVEGP